MLPSKFCPQLLPKSALFDFRCNSCPHSLPFSIVTMELLQTSREEVVHADVSAVASYYLLPHITVSDATLQFIEILL